VISMLVQPTAQHYSAGKRAPFFRQINEDHLRHILGQMCVLADQTSRRRIDKVDVARDQFPKGRFRPVRRVFREQCLAVRHILH
jgi:hypothetical protein